MKAENRRIAIIIATLLLLVAVVYFFSDIVAYIIIAWVISMIGQPLMDFLMKYIRVGKKFKLGRTPAAAITLLTFIFAISLLGMIFVPLIIDQANNLSSVQYNQIYETLQDPINWVNDKLIDLGIISQDELSSENFINQISEWFKPSFITDFLGNVVGLAGSLFIGLFSILFIAFFFLREINLFNNLILAMVPDEYENETLEVVDDISKLLRKYFAGVLLQITIITTIVTIGLSIFGIKNALLIAFFAGLINVIPYVGPFIGAVFGVFITVSSNLNVDFYTVLSPMLLKVVIVFAIMQMIDNFILQPFIFGNSVKAHPLEIFILILVAAKIGGITGMILAIPSYTVIRVVAKEFLNQFKIVQRLTNSLDKK